MNEVREPLDMKTELMNIKARLEALEQRVYTIDSRTVGMIKLDPGPDHLSPYDFGAVATALKRVKRKA